MSSLEQRPVYSGLLTEAALADTNNTHAILLQLVGDHQVVLEIGPATGYMTRVLVERQHCQVTGFEINAEAAALARPFLQQLIVGDLENESDLAHLTGQFDVILIGDVLEHLAEPNIPLRAFHDHLHLTGRLIISLPNVAHWTIRRSLLRGQWDLTDRGVMDRTHLRWYTRRTAMALLYSNGYRVRQRRASYIFPGHRRLGLKRLAIWAQTRAMPGAFDDLFAIQHILVATPA